MKRDCREHQTDPTIHHAVKWTLVHSMKCICLVLSLGLCTVSFYHWGSVQLCSITGALYSWVLSLGLCTVGFYDWSSVQLGSMNGALYSWVLSLGLCTVGFYDWSSVQLGSMTGLLYNLLQFLYYL